MSSTIDPNLTQKKVVCPHCWSSFYSDNAKYIASHESLYGDPKLGNQAKRRLDPSEIQTTRSGLLYDPAGEQVVDRACPYCHLQIPQELLQKRPHFISVVGAPRSGKTYFLTSMIHSLRRELAQHFGFSFQDSDSHDVKAFLAYERELFYPNDPTSFTLLRKTEEQGELYNRVRLNDTDMLFPKPFIFSLRPTEANLDVAAAGDRLNCNFVIYDNAGESFAFMKEQNENNRATQHLSRTNAVFFAYDPLQVPSLRKDLLGVSNDPQLTKAAHTERQETILLEAANRMRRRSTTPANEPLSPLLCVCVQKFDVWQALLSCAKDQQGGFVRQRFPECGLPMPAAISHNDELGIAGLDVEEINLVSVMVGEFVRRVNPEFHTLAEANFKTVRYFPVSALGTSPQYEPDRVPVSKDDRRLLKVRPIDIKPWQVTHAMLYFMFRSGLIHRIPPRSQGRETYPHAEIVDVRTNRLRIKSPYSKRHISLDHEYAGSTIEDPFSGKLIWVPETSATASPRVVPAATTAHIGQEQAPEPKQRDMDSLKLKLDQPKKSPKKSSWFGKPK